MQKILLTTLKFEQQISFVVELVFFLLKLPVKGKTLERV